MSRPTATSNNSQLPHIPLTAVYAPPASCLGEIDPSIITEARDGYYYWNYDPSAFSGTTTSCYPPKFKPGLTQVYSPGVCPEGKTLMETVTVEGELRGLCCQKGWSSNREYPDYCSRNFNGDDLWQPGVSIRWHSSDIPLFVSARATATATVTAFISSTPDSSPQPHISSNSSKGGVDGKTIGIAVGSCVAAIAVIGGSLFYAFRKKKKWIGTPEAGRGAPVEIGGGKGSMEKQGGGKVGDIEAVAGSGTVKKKPIPQSPKIVPVELPGSERIELAAGQQYEKGGFGRK